MSSFRVRPRFRQIVDLDADAVQARLASHLSREGSRCTVKNFPGYLSLRIPEQDAHFWSPQLNLSLDATDDGKTLINGTYGPNPNVWSLFLYGYLLVGTLGMLAAILGFSQWLIDLNPWGWWIFGAMAAGAIILYLVAQFGQKLGAWQTFLLHQAYESAIGQSVEIH